MFESDLITFCIDPQLQTFVEVKRKTQKQFISLLNVGDCGAFRRQEKKPAAIIETET